MSTDLGMDQLFDGLATIGWRGDQPDQGRDCLAYSENEDLAHAQFAQFVETMKAQAKAQGMSLHLEVDPFGNSYAVLEGRSEREVMICSHLDSVPNGGRFDGVMGVAMGLDTIHRFIECGERPPKTIRVAGFRAEESSVTGHSCLGSTLATGRFEIETLRTLRHARLNQPLLEVLATRGVDEAQLSQLQTQPALDARKLDAVVEAHVEQSPVLEFLGQSVGVVVKGIGGARRSDLRFRSREMDEFQTTGKNILRITIHGKAGHSGGLPMNGERIYGAEMVLRHDALLAAAQFLTEGEDDLPLIQISVPQGGSYNTVQGECTLEVLVPAKEGVDMEHWRAQMRPFLLPGMSCEMELIVPGDHRIRVIQDYIVDAAMSAIVECNTLAGRKARMSSGLVRATVGKIKFDDDGSIILGVDQRRLDNEEADDFASQFDDRLRVIVSDTNVGIQEVGEKVTLATPLSPAIADVMRESYRRLFDSDPVEMGSMPGHDASRVIRALGDDLDELIPGGMIFVRGFNDGISHHPSELSKIEDMKKAADLLYETVLNL